MGMAPQTIKWTADMLRSLPDDGKQYEIVDGELLVTPAPSWRHGNAVSELYVPLYNYCRSSGVGYAKISPQDVEFDNHNVVEPDLFVVPLVGGAKPLSWEEVGRLLVAIEIPSPSSARSDRITKRRLYQRRGVPEYWVVDIEARLVERWRPDDERPEILADHLVWQPDPAALAFELDLPAYFAEVLGAEPGPPHSSR
ncbi:MAG TPA: Uma2 family endonuclease [Gemmatimonadales bacterium]|nr:Uma2 family endonuclease [Gemmatimonadales bacterium]